jgi:threonine synthase
LHAVRISDEQTSATIKSAYERHGIVLEPHGAVGWAGLEHYLSEHSESADRLAVSVETAHPAKFPEEIRALIGVDPETPPSLAGLESRPESYETLSTSYEPFRDWLKRSGLSGRIPLDP